MDYYTIGNSNQITNLDYLSLVNMLTTQITPETRSQILSRLTEINDQLILSSGIQSQQLDLSRCSSMNSRKKDATELQHPSMDIYNYKGNNPIPFSIPINSSNQFSMNGMNGMNTANTMKNMHISGMPPMYNMQQMVQQTPQTIPNIFSGSNSIHGPNYSNNHQFEQQTNIDLDEILGDIHNSPAKPDSLDQELDRIKQLYNRIAAGKLQRRRDRERS